jgi:hypothetical protein
MEREYRGRLNLLGALAVFVVLTPVLLLMNAAYILIVAFLPSIYLCIVATVAFGFIIAKLIKTLFKVFKVSNRFVGLIFVLAALAIGIYFKWCFWLGYFGMFFSVENLNIFSDMGSIIDIALYYIKAPSDAFFDILYYNEYGTWTYENISVTGIPLTIVWIAEFLIMNVPPLYACFESNMVFIPEYNAWATPAYAPVIYDRFDDYELEALAALNFHPIVEKPPSLRPSGKKTYRLAFLTVKGAFTGYAAVYKLTRVNNTLTGKIQGRPIFIGEEQCGKLDALLNEKHAPEFPVNAITGIETSESVSENEPMA